MDNFDYESLLEYPYKTDLIFRKKSKIKEHFLNSSNNFLEIKIAILGGSTTDEVKNILEVFLLKIGIKADFYESTYDRFYEESVFINEDLDSFNPDIIYIHTSNKNIFYEEKLNFSQEEIQKTLNQEITKYKEIWGSLEKYKCPVIQNNFELEDSRPMGNLSLVHKSSKNFFINEMNSFFSAEGLRRSNLYINDINYLSSLSGLSNWYDRSLWYRAKYFLSYSSIIYLSKNLSSLIQAIYGKSKKVLVLDLDNTCWKGVIGDDGVEGILLGVGTPEGEAYLDFQKYVKQLKDRGVILAINSKNDEKNALEGLMHPSSIIKKEDFSCIKANWNPKDQNILEISDQLNISPDDMVFLDDNPAERELVKNLSYNIAVPNIGNNVEQFIDYLDKNYFFETNNISEEDLNRTAFYKNSVNLNSQLEQSRSYDEFLTSLEMKAEIKPFSQENLERIHQLINKTNQFNLLTERMTFEEVKNTLDNPSYITLSGKLEDKFGDNGLISVLIGEVKESNLDIKNWVMSCRVFKRNFEYAMFKVLCLQALNKGLLTVSGKYIPTKKNSIVCNLYKELGFDMQREEQEFSEWILSLKDFKELTIPIEFN